MAHQLLRLCELTCAVLAADSVQMWLLDAEQGCFRPACHVGEPAERWEVLKLLTVPLVVVEDHRIEAERSGALWVPAPQFSGDNASGCAAFARRVGAAL